MNEADARRALLVRAYETAPAAQTDGRWTDSDRGWATQSALQVEGEQASADAFIARRARLAAGRLCERDRGAERALRTLSWRGWIGWTLALLAFAAGIATDAVGAGRQINVLAPPLLAVLLWNFCVYAALALRAAAPASAAGKIRLGPLARQLVRAAQAFTFGSGTETPAPLLAGFARDWIAASMPLSAARAARILHTAAAAFAGGTLLGMYLRGIALEYRAGWESTFLDASAVHTLLAVLLWPATAISGIALPDEAALAAIRFSASPGENAARWIHLYAVTTALLVLAPRALLALRQYLIERRLEDTFPLPLADGYFQALARARLGTAAAACVVPYSYRPDQHAASALNALFARVFGAACNVAIAPTVPFGGEDALDLALPGSAPLALVAALFSLAATPERENHGAFIGALAARLPPSTPLAVLVDESAFIQRFGDSGGARRDERRAAWQRMLASTGREAVFVDLAQQDFNVAGRALRAALGTVPAHAAKD